MMAAESAAPAPAPGTQLFRSLRSLRQAPGASMYYLGKKNEVEEAEKAAETSPEVGSMASELLQLLLNAIWKLPKMMVKR